MKSNQIIKSNQIMKLYKSNSIDMEFPLTWNLKKIIKLKNFENQKIQKNGKF